MFITYIYDGEIRDAVLDRMSDIQHDAPKRVQRKKRLNVTTGKVFHPQTIIIT